VGEEEWDKILKKFSCVPHCCRGNMIYLHYQLRILFAEKQGVLQMDSREQIEKIYQRTTNRHIALTVGVPELYQKWISNTFSTKVIVVQNHCFTMPTQQDMMVFVNTDAISNAELYKIKRLQDGEKCGGSDVEFYYVTEKQLQYYYENPYWVMCSYWPCQDISEMAYHEHLAYANLVLKEAGYRCIRDRYLFSYGVLHEYDVYVQSAIWEDSKGAYFLPLFHEGGFGRGSAEIEIAGLHDDVFLTEGFVPINLSQCDMKTEILSLAT